MLSIRGNLPSTAPFDSDLVDSCDEEHSSQVTKSHITPTVRMFHSPSLDLTPNSNYKMVGLNFYHQQPPAIRLLTDFHIKQRRVKPLKIGSLAATSLLSAPLRW